MPNRNLTCKLCGKTFRRKVTPSAMRQGHQFLFCSPICRNKARSLAEVPCPICRTMFKPARINGAGQPRQRFCSQKCASIGQHGKPSPNRTRAEIVETIKKVYPTEGAQPLAKRFHKSIKAIQLLATKSGIRLKPEVYRQRVHESARAYMKTPKNPGYKHGQSCKVWGNNWPEQRRATLNRDHYICQHCGSTARTVHHIKPRRDFIGHMEDANSLSNLITLCASDHERVEMNKIKCPRPT